MQYIVFIVNIEHLNDYSTTNLFFIFFRISQRAKLKEYMDKVEALKDAKLSKKWSPGRKLDNESKLDRNMFLTIKLVCACAGSRTYFLDPGSL